MKLEGQLRKIFMSPSCRRSDRVLNEFFSAISLAWSLGKCLATHVPALTRAYVMALTTSNRPRNL